MYRLKIGAFIIDNLRNLIDAAPATVKIISAWKLGLLASVFPAVFESLSGWYIENSVYMSFVFIAIFLDHLLGSYVHWFILKDWSWKKNRNGLFQKFSSTIVGYILLEMLHQIVDDVDFIAIYLKVTLQLVVFLYPAASAFGNLHIVTNGKMPPSWLMRGVKKFEQDGDLNHFNTTKKKGNESENLRSGEPEDVIEDVNNGDPRD